MASAAGRRRSAGLDEAERASVARACETLTRGSRSCRPYTAARQDRLDRTRAYRSGLALALRRDARKLRRTFHTALGLLARSPDFIFNQSTAHYYAQVEQDDPALFAAIRERVARAVGADRRQCGSSRTPTCPPANRWRGNCSTGNGISSARSACGRACAGCRIASVSRLRLPQLLAQAGIDSFFTIKVTWSETNKFPHDLFWWEGLDGSAVLAHTSTIRSPAITVLCVLMGRRRLGRVSARRTGTTSRCSRSAMATEAAASRPTWWRARFNCAISRRCRGRAGRASTSSSHAPTRARLRARCRCGRAKYTWSCTARR